MSFLKKSGTQELADRKDFGIKMNSKPMWLPMTDEDWEWVNYGRLPQK
jgi:hypothetical protein